MTFRNPNANWSLHWFWGIQFSRALLSYTAMHQNSVLVWFSFRFSHGWIYMAETITAVKVLGIKEEQEVVVAYASKHLSDRETKWSTTEKEAYAIHAVKTFYPYLYGRPFKVYTDHRPLQWLMNVQDPTGKLARWWLELQLFKIKIDINRVRRIRMMIV